MAKKLFKAALVFAICSILIGAVFYHTATRPAVLKEASGESRDFLDEEAVKSERGANTFATFLAVGDVMMHEGQIWAGYNDAAGSFDYSEFFHVVKDQISGADIAMADLETTLGGKEKEYTGYPMFNSPDEIADALRDAGFDIIVTSNNHSLDRGAEGALRTIRVLKEKGLIPIGTYESEEARNQIAVENVNGINMAFLSYTYGTNGIPIPKGKEYLVNLIDKDLIAGDLQKARQMADVVIVYLHFGEEYQRTPSSAQRELAHFVLENGADVIVASHPHVTQPSQWVEVSDSDEENEIPGTEQPNPTESGSTDSGNTEESVFPGTAQPYRKYIIYSMGNFISAQRFPHTEEGLMIKVTFEKDAESGKTHILDVKEIDTWVDKFVRDGRMRYVVRYGKKPA
ncbi:hypothetical protein TSYNTROOL_20050 [Tepidanaerobacter syntrophicus]|uniref:CapA family protein n=1 Tax=Tepidanaerobacter syntrophicus TaxID=224999 RepID=UPI0022EDA9CB|nr:CapA family protein [Tepidanaerobacter syntrophicus]GLI51919.1 hypothetical protein TSYNTROOL_20050 [Tepidanaerobacter syntrophicus]